MPTFPVPSPNYYTGVKVVDAPSPEWLQDLYTAKQVGWDGYLPENQYLVIKSSESASALAKYKDGQVHLLNQRMLERATAIKPRNKEQYFALDALLDDTIKVVTLTGNAGSGKTLLSLAVCIAKMEQHTYKRIILSRPSSQVGNRDLGLLPGTHIEKLMPFLMNYVSNFRVLFPNALEFKLDGDLEFLFNRYNIEIVPLQLIRGASFNDCLVLVDECQILNHHEMLTVGTRISEGSKLVIMGDLNQRDEPIAKEKTGIYTFVNDSQVQGSPFVSNVHLIKSERGCVSQLFSDVFDGG